MQEKKQKKKPSSSYMVQALAQDKHPVLPVYIIEVIAALFLDVLRIASRFICSILIIVITSVSILGGIAFYKLKPVYESYMDEAKTVVEKTSKDTFRCNETTIIYDKDGKVLADLSKDRVTTYLPYQDIPKQAVQAFVSIEDRSFWTNPGIDPKGIMRVSIKAVKTRGKELHGASTITQQLARMVFLSSDVNLNRKFKEIAIAIELTKKYSKEDIMEFYVNNCYFGNQCYGLEAASQKYFRKTSSELSLGQITYLCAIPNSPVYYDPYVNPGRAYSRRTKILNAMYELGYISDTEREEADKETETIITEKGEETSDAAATYAMDCAIRYFMKLSDFPFQYHFKDKEDYNRYLSDYNAEYESMRTELYRGGYRINTTIDMGLQDGIQKIADGYIRKNRKKTGLKDLETSVVLTDTNASVLAIIGGCEKTAFGFNRGYQSYRQPGSSIKPLIVYAPAIENGYTENTQVKNIDVTAAKKKLKQAAKYGAKADLSKVRGYNVPLSYALIHSLNGAAYSIMYDLSPQKCLPYLEEMKFTKIVPEDYTLSAALGGFTYGVTPAEMAGAYACLSNEGIYHEPTCLASIKDRYGKERYIKEEGLQIYHSDTVETLKSMMKEVPKSGTARGLQWYKSSKETLYAKTGTTDDRKDGWMCGFTGQYAIAVWTGCDTPKELPGDGASTSGELLKSALLYALRRKS